MGSLPAHGRVGCSVCFEEDLPSFDRARTGTEVWRITSNPLAWGSQNPDVVVLGFSKGPTQAGALSSARHNDIAFKGGRTALAKVLHHIGLIERPEACLVEHLIADPEGQFHFGSLIRCTVERFDDKSDDWTGTGGGMLDRFVADPFGLRIASNCSQRFLSDLPARTRLVVMLGLGTKGNYVAACRQIYQKARPGPWWIVNEVAYADDQVVVVHTEHFAAQGALIPNWLAGRAHERGWLGLLAREAVGFALTRPRAAQ